MGSIKKFKYVYLPADNEKPMEERDFMGDDDEFTKMLQEHFQKVELPSSGKEELKNFLVDEMKKKNVAQDKTATVMDQIINSTGLYEVVTVRAHAKANNFTGVSMFVDDYGQYKKLPENQRASSVANQIVNGDAFIIKSFDNGNDYKKFDFAIKDAIDIAKENEKTRNETKEQKRQESTPATTCAFCLIKGIDMKRCARCKEVYYCDQSCQKKHWKTHKTTCAESPATSR